MLKHRGPRLSLRAADDLVPTEDQILTADTSGISDDDGLGTFAYQWLRDGDEIDGATGRQQLTRITLPLLLPG